MNMAYSSTVSSAIFTGNSDTTYLFALTTTLNSGSIYSATATVQATTYPAALSNVIPMILTSTSVTIEFSPSSGANSYSYILFAQRFAFSPFLPEPSPFSLSFPFWQFLFVDLQHWTAVDPGLSFHNSTRTEWFGDHLQHECKHCLHCENLCGAWNCGIPFAIHNLSFSWVSPPWDFQFFHLISIFFDCLIDSL